jgi:hypothetical protein
MVFLTIVNYRAFEINTMVTAEMRINITLYYL